MPSFPLVLDGLSRLAARGLSLTTEYANSNLAKRGQDEPPKFPEMTKWGIAIVTITTVLFVFLLVSVCLHILYSGEV